MSNNDDYVINLYMHMKIKDQYAIGPAADKSKIYSQVNVYHSSDNKTTMIKYKTNDNIPFCITMTRTLFDNRSIISRVTELILDLYQLLFNINTRTPKAATIADVTSAVAHDESFSGCIEFTRILNKYEHKDMYLTAQRGNIKNNFIIYVTPSFDDNTGYIKEVRKHFINPKDLKVDPAKYREAIEHYDKLPIMLSMKISVVRYYRRFLKIFKKKSSSK